MDIHMGLSRTLMLKFNENKYKSFHFGINNPEIILGQTTGTRNSIQKVKRKSK